MANSKQRQVQKNKAQSLSVVFHCICNQHHCGCFDTVLLDKIPLCAFCGQPKQATDKTYYGLEHGWYCKHKSQ